MGELGDLEDVTVAILAGGKSTRMGADKALTALLGRPLVEHAAARLRGLGRETLLITNTPEAHAGAGLPMFSDVIPGKGPLGGIYTALTHAAGDYVLVVAVDMPFLNRDLLRYMIGLAAGHDAVVPRMGGLPEGLHAVYGKACLEPIRARLAAGRLSVKGFFADVRVRYVEAAEIDRFDPERRSFFNVNTPDDLEAARRLLADDAL